eukprot:CAMPEP_0117420688 /NCGR_PEP_ID=MMETSP0758-20121206/1962_1 /TAXON_ID=63605 /ORGANISM="Percolomonas cosmopolitus, Strain AE-1 (ATCC 50343)" /LENGTH=377 /DNA_ID=CAMNT_0005202427 /DNA_START=675 /DNA_END=1805 /DNA_ORIENTATION=+
MNSSVDELFDYVNGDNTKFVKHKTPPQTNNFMYEDRPHSTHIKTPRLGYSAVQTSFYSPQHQFSKKANKEAFIESWMAEIEEKNQFVTAPLMPSPRHRNSQKPIADHGWDQIEKTVDSLKDNISPIKMFEDKYDRKSVAVQCEPENPSNEKALYNAIKIQVEEEEEVKVEEQQMEVESLDDEAHSLYSIENEPLEYEQRLNEVPNPPEQEEDTMSEDSHSSQIRESTENINMKQFKKFKINMKKTETGTVFLQLDQLLMPPSRALEIGDQIIVKVYIVPLKQQEPFFEDRTDPVFETTPSSSTNENCSFKIAQEGNIVINQALELAQLEFACYGIDHEDGTEFKLIFGRYPLYKLVKDRFSNVKLNKMIEPNQNPSS